MPSQKAVLAEIKKRTVHSDSGVRDIATAIVHLINHAPPRWITQTLANLPLINKDPQSCAIWIEKIILSELIFPLGKAYLANTPLVFASRLKLVQKFLSGSQPKTWEKLAHSITPASASKLKNFPVQTHRATRYLGIGQHVILPNITRFQNRGLTIADLGASSGAGASAIASLGINISKYWAVDLFGKNNLLWILTCSLRTKELLTPDVINLFDTLAHPHPKLEYLNTDLANTNLPSGSCDIVIATYSLYQLESKSKLNQAISEAKRILAPNGMIILTDNFNLSSPTSGKHGLPSITTPGAGGDLATFIINRLDDGSYSPPHLIHRWGKNTDLTSPLINTESPVPYHDHITT
jgi:SAM-dependent methyltransferase